MGVPEDTLFSDTPNGNQYGSNVGIANYLKYSYALNHNAIDLSNQIGNYQELQNLLLKKNNIYDYDGNTLQLSNNKKPTIFDAVNEDTRLLLLQENTIYIFAFILMSTFLILALMVGSEQ
jgi:hypothetical protein